MAPRKAATPAKDSKANSPATHELEKKRLLVAAELMRVEEQIYDLETKYLEAVGTVRERHQGVRGLLGWCGAAEEDHNQAGGPDFLRELCPSLTPLVKEGVS